MLSNMSIKLVGAAKGNLRVIQNKHLGKQFCIEVSKIKNYLITCVMDVP
jgi:hypothetical protein